MLTSSHDYPVYGAPGSPGSGGQPGGGNSNLPYSGDMTFYTPGLGACGHRNTESDNICAISHILYDASSKGANPNTNPLCGRTLKAVHTDSASGQEKELVLTVVDRCEACKQWDIDLSPGAFGRLEGDQGLGRVKVNWGWT